MCLCVCGCVCMCVCVRARARVWVCVCKCVFHVFRTHPYRQANLTMFYVRSASFQEKQKTIVRKIVRLTEHIFEKHVFQILTQHIF